MKQIMKISTKAVLIIMLLITLAACKKEDKTGNEETETSKALSQEELVQELYDFQNPYIGDASSDGDLLFALRVQENLGAYKIELETEEEPYTLRLVFSEMLKKEEEFNTIMKQNATILLALIENASEIQWVYENDNGEETTQTWTIEDAENEFQINDVKSYASSKEKVKELLEIIE